MDVKNDFVAVKNFKKVNSDVILDATTIYHKGAIIYAKFDEDDNCEFISGNIGAMICAIAEIIIMMSKKSGFPITSIVKTILNDVYVLSDEEVDNEI